MKNFKALLLSLAVSICCVGCASLEPVDPYVRLERSIPYLKVSSTLIANSIFTRAVSKDDRKEKAKIIFDVAELIEKSTENGEVDINQIGELVSRYVPNKPHWNEFSAALILIYADIHARSRDLPDQERNKILAQALNAVAGGCKRAAAAYLE